MIPKTIKLDNVAGLPKKGIVMVGGIPHSYETIKLGTPKPTKEDRLRGRIERLKERAKVKKEPRISDLKKIVQRKVNAYVRERDKDQPCISCGKEKGNQAGHYIAQGSSGYLRYHPWNISLQGNSCNLYKHGNLVEYRIGLVKKIGALQVEWLENNRHKECKWTREMLERILEYCKHDTYDVLYCNDEELHTV